MSENLLSYNLRLSWSRITEMVAFPRVFVSAISTTIDLVESWEEMDQDRLRLPDWMDLATNTTFRTVTIPFVESIRWVHIPCHWQEAGEERSGPSSPPMERTVDACGKPWADDVAFIATGCHISRFFDGFFPGFPDAPEDYSYSWPRRMMVRLAVTMYDDNFTSYRQRIGCLSNAAGFMAQPSLLGSWTEIYPSRTYMVCDRDSDLAGRTPRASQQSSRAHACRCDFEGSSEGSPARITRPEYLDHDPDGETLTPVVDMPSTMPNDVRWPAWSASFRKAAADAGEAFLPGFSRMVGPVDRRRSSGYDQCRAVFLGSLDEASPRILIADPGEPEPVLVDDGWASVDADPSSDYQINILAQHRPEVGDWVTFQSWPFNIRDDTSLVGYTVLFVPQTGNPSTGMYSPEAYSWMDPPPTLAEVYDMILEDAQAWADFDEQSVGVQIYRVRHGLTTPVAVPHPPPREYWNYGMQDDEGISVFGNQMIDVWSPRRDIPPPYDIPSIDGQIIPGGVPLD